MIRFAYCVMEQLTAVNHGDETLAILNEETLLKPVEKIRQALKSRAKFVPQQIEHVTELEVERITVIDRNVIQGWLSEVPVPIWDQGPILVAPGDEVLGSPGWYETEGLDQLFLLLKEVLTSLRYARPWFMYEGYVDYAIQWAEEGVLDLMKVEHLFSRRSIYYPTESFLEKSAQ